MSKTERYFNCTFEQGTARASGWIEARGAKLGAQVELLGDGLSGLWTVTSVGDKTLDKERIRFAQAANKHASIS